MQNYSFYSLLLFLLFSCSNDLKEKTFSLTDFDKDYKALLSEKQIDTLTYTRGILLKKERILDKLENKSYSKVIQILDNHVKESGHFEKEIYEDAKIKVVGLKKKIEKDSILFEYTVNFKDDDTVNKII